MGRVLGVDPGDRRTGVALSDPDRILASPLERIDDPSPRRVAARLAELVREHDAEAVVVGLALNMDGSEGPRARAGRDFAARLQALVEVPVHVEDERLTTVAAADALRRGGAKAARRRELLDQVAAQILLQDWLDRHRPPEEHAP